MRRLAGELGITSSAESWPALVEAATFDYMRSRPDEFLPTSGGIHKDSSAFFRRGSSGAAAEVLTPEEQSRYHRRAAQFAPPDLLTWLHRSPTPSGSVSPPDMP